MKRTKNQVSRYASLRSWPLPCKAGKTWGGACCRHCAQGQRFRQHSGHPCSRTRPASFYLLSPEAARLTGLQLLNILHPKKRAKACQKTGTGSLALRVEGFF